MKSCWTNIKRATYMRFQRHECTDFLYDGMQDLWLVGITSIKYGFDGNGASSCFFYPFINVCKITKSQLVTKFK